jgi:hypothetical protein
MIAYDYHIMCCSLCVEFSFSNNFCLVAVMGKVEVALKNQQPEIQNHQNVMHASLIPTVLSLWRKIDGAHAATVTPLRKSLLAYCRTKPGQ